MATPSEEKNLPATYSHSVRCSAPDELQSANRWITLHRRDAWLSFASVLDGLGSHSLLFTAPKWLSTTRWERFSLWGWSPCRWRTNRLWTPVCYWVVMPPTIATAINWDWGRQLNEARSSILRNCPLHSVVAVVWLCPRWRNKKIHQLFWGFFCCCFFCYIL